LYFLASTPDTLADCGGTDVLMAMNDLHTPRHEEIVADLVGQGVRILIDSGIYNLTMSHARLHRISMDEALRTPVDRIDGFQALYARYVGFLQRWGSRVWGYIELDLGGPEGKRATRTTLEALGLQPIPVYHPLNDGWEYFDELAEGYDRLCFGNVVHASLYTRLRLVATAWERKRQYPELWIHLLGMTPNEWLNAYPIDSCDSSAWLGTVRWDGYDERTCLKTLGKLPKNFQYQLGDRGTWTLGRQMGSMGALLNQANYRRHLAALREVGLYAD
jgi:hypothetical protein